MVCVYFYLFHASFAKFSVLGLYHRIFGINRSYRTWIYVIGAAQTVLIICVCILQGFQCRPFSKFFDPNLPGTCTDEGTVIISGELPNSLIDFVMVALVMVMIRPRQMRPSTKWRLRFLFGMGSL